VPAPLSSPTPPDFRSYFIELRIGTPEWRLSRVIVEAGRRYGLRDPMGVGRPFSNLMPSAPHISLYGGFVIRPGFMFSDVTRVIQRLCRATSPFTYHVEGFESRLGYSGGVIAFKVVPSAELAAFRTELIHHLGPVTEDLFPMNNNPDDLWYHITIGYRLDSGTYEQMRSDLVGTDPASRQSAQGPGDTPDESCQKGFPPGLVPITLPADALRVSILHRNRIAAEYDLMSGRWLGRRAAQSDAGWGRTLSRYRLFKGYELKTSPYQKRGPLSHVIADLNFGQPPSIPWYSRPFREGDTRTMDQVLIRNWNQNVRNGDEVFLIGTTASCKPPGPEHYLARLNGHIHHIPGDEGCTMPGSAKMRTHTVNGVELLFVSDPGKVPPDFNGYVVHGNRHNSDLLRFPFFDPEHRRFNVCAELVGYRPVPLDILGNIAGKFRSRIEVYR
jgi:calcineurin-like phosphoesterase family protein